MTLDAATGGIAAEIGTLGVGVTPVAGLDFGLGGVLVGSVPGLDGTTTLIEIDPATAAAASLGIDRFILWDPSVTYSAGALVPR